MAATRVASGETRVSSFFSLERDQGTLDFVDVPIGNDVNVFLDPSRLRSMQGKWAAECVSLLQAYFESVLTHLQVGNDTSGISLLSALVERNEFHLGMSSGLADGRAFGPGYAEKVWLALQRSKARTTGLLRDLEDTSLFIDGIGADRISDAVCNILRGPLIRYTQEMCVYYGIPLTSNVPSGPIWNIQTEAWEDAFVSLPMTPFGRLILVPKLAVRHKIQYDSKKYYTHYLLPAMEFSERAANTALVRTLKNGARKVDKKALRKKYGADKMAIVDQTIRHPTALDDFRRSAVENSRPLSHETLASVENIVIPRYEALLQAVLAVPPGKDGASAYENAIEKFLSAILYPSLCYPRKQDEIHDGRKRIDITYVNSPTGGFFHWLSLHYASANIFVECKNYGREVGNPEIDQLAGRFSPSRGQVGILVCRSVENEALLQQRCADTARDQRGYIIFLTDRDLEIVKRDYINDSGAESYPLLREKFRRLLA